MSHSALALSLLVLSLICASARPHPYPRSLGTRRGLLFRSALPPFSRRARCEVRAKAETEKKPWDFPRFVKTVATFSPPPSPVKLIRRVLGQKETDQKISLRTNQDIWNIANPLGLRFAPLDDVVMGGVSRSTFEVGAESGRFSGYVDEANNGGFTGVRTLPLDSPLDMSGVTGIRLKVKGDGKRYKCTIRDTPDFNGITWTMEFDTQKGGGFGGSWQTVDLPLNKFIATRFANILEGERLDTSQIWAIQLVLSKYAYDGKLNPKFQPGEMQLLVKSISAY
mmetsp:Transcript_20483/g.28603  ORF Transcript_20483/g.28603 Transcript_20483/m.28603 type:complete len:281 (-) Transcript_20483:131-973(-)|eukprot:CAMPEP_0184492402 /NCGR_PEP_ID=MMETSP0113_2-20130426/23135_1 /TAXON_ID=91329 /ORGANISM="Norrisiella sphaerica, Strain BC52" /LENGTH=280 /DNA_ID=CAMNT_0026877187 /DNA_START=91 /DNA_END=933 /DNA_ORIENTATION=+